MPKKGTANNKKSKVKKKEMTFGEGLISGLQEIVEYNKGDKTQIADIRTVEIKPIPKITASDIKKIRKQHHLSQTMLAKIIGVSNRTVEAWEHGINEPTGGSARLLSMMKEDSKLIETYNLIKTT